jgi:hypothetical protein
MKFIFLHDEDGNTFALNPEKVISVHDCDDFDRKAKTEIFAEENSMFYAREKMADVVSAMIERDGENK